MAGNGTLLGVGLAVMLRDQFSAPASRINQSSKNLKQNLAALTSAQSQFYRSLGFTSVAMSSAWYGLSRVIEAGARYKYTLVSVQAVTESTNRELQKMDKLAMDLGQNTIFHSDQVADAMKYMGMAGMKYAEIMGSIPAAVNLAGATDSALQGKLGTADIMTNIMKTFSLGVEHSNAVADILTVATVKANTNLTDLAQGIKYAGSTANSLNIPLQELTAGLMLLSNAGIQGSMAGVAMENAMRYFARALGPQATGRQVKALQQLGLSVEDFQDRAGRMLSLPVIFEKLQVAMRKVGTGTIAGQNILDNLFGVRGKRAATLLVRDGDQLKDFVNQLNNSAGESAKIMDMRMNTLWGHILQFITVVKHLGIVFTDSISEPLKFFLTGINTLLRGLVHLMQVPIFKSIIGPTFLVLTTWRLVRMAIRMAGYAFDILKAKALVASGEAVSAGNKQQSMMSMLAANITKATIAQEGLTAAVMRTVKAYYAQGAAAGMATSTAGMPFLYKAGGKPVPDTYAGYVKTVKGKSPWSAPKQVNGQWVIYNKDEGHKIFSTKKEATEFRSTTRPEYMRPATNSEINKGWGVSWFGTTPAQQKAAKAAEAAAKTSKIGFWGKLLVWMPWLGKIGGWLGKALPWLSRIGSGILKVFGVLSGPVGMIITLVASIGMSLWSWFRDKKEEDNKQTELLGKLANKDAEEMIRNGENIRLASQWLNNNQENLRSYQAEAIRAANTSTAVKDLYGLNAISNKMGDNVSPNEVGSLGKDNKAQSINFTLQIGDETLRRVLKAQVQDYTTKTVTEIIED